MHSLRMSIILADPLLILVRAASVFWLWLRKPNWNHYEVSPDGSWLEKRLLRQKRLAQIWWTLALGVVIVALHPQWKALVLGLV